MSRPVQPAEDETMLFIFLLGLRVGTVKRRSGTSQGSHEADLFGMLMLLMMVRAQISSSNTIQAGKLNNLIKTK